MEERKSFRNCLQSSLSIAESLSSSVPNDASHQVLLHMTRTLGALRTRSSISDSIAALCECLEHNQIQFHDDLFKLAFFNFARAFAVVIEEQSGQVVPDSASDGISSTTTGKTSALLTVKRPTPSLSPPAKRSRGTPLPSSSTATLDIPSHLVHNPLMKVLSSSSSDSAESSTANPLLQALSSSSGSPVAASTNQESHSANDDGQVCSALAIFANTRAVKREDEEETVWMDAMRRTADADLEDKFFQGALGLDEIFGGRLAAAQKHMSCAYCNEFDNNHKISSQLTIHVRNAHRDKWNEYATICCPKKPCDFRCTSTSSLKNHNRKVHAPNYELNWEEQGRYDFEEGSRCRLCHKPQSSLGDLISHYEDAHPTADTAGFIGCTKCFVLFDFVYELLMHWNKSPCNGKATLTKDYPII